MKIPNSGKPSTAQVTKTATQKKEAASRLKQTRRRPPRTAAVTLICPPEQYTQAMRVAKESIKLEELKIQTVRPKKAVTGALILEIPGPEGKKKANALKEKLETAL